MGEEGGAINRGGRLFQLFPPKMGNYSRGAGRKNRRTAIIPRNTVYT